MTPNPSDIARAVETWPGEPLFFLEVVERDQYGAAVRTQTFSPRPSDKCDELAARVRLECPHLDVTMYPLLTDKEQKMVSNAMALAKAASHFTPAQIDTLKNTIARDLEPTELALFLEVCRHTSLDPFRREIYAIKRESKKGPTITFQTSIDGFRSLAERSGEYEGQTPPQWCGEDGLWKDVWLAKSPPAAARVGVYRKGMREPLYGVARFDSYYQSGGAGLWDRMPDVMIAKCAESLAIRKGFPRSTAGIYTDEEMGQADESHEARLVRDLGEAILAAKTLEELAEVDARAHANKAALVASGHYKTVADWYRKAKARLASTAKTNQAALS